MAYKDFVKFAIRLGFALTILVLLSELQVTEAACIEQCNEPTGINYLRCSTKKKRNLRPTKITCDRTYKFRAKRRKVYQLPRGANYITITEVSIPEHEELYVSDVTCPNDKCKILRLRKKADEKTPILSIIRDRKFEISSKKKRGKLTFQCFKEECMNLGDPCTRSRQCESIDHATCKEGSCVCATNYQQVENTNVCAALSTSTPAREITTAPRTTTTTPYETTTFPPS